MRTLLRGFTVLCLAAGTMVWAVNKSGTISSAQTWSGSITLTGDVTITGGTVTIQPGTQVGGSNDLKVKGAGVIKAVGTPSSRIKFTNKLVIMEALTRDDECIFQYCDLYASGGCALEFRNPSGVTELSGTAFDHCNFIGGGNNYCIMYVTSGGSPHITNCHFEKAKIGIFVHGGDTLEVKYSSFTDVSCGIVSAGMGSSKQFYEPMQTYVEHCVFYDIDATRETSYMKMCKGVGVYTQNYPGKAIIRNNIFQNCAINSIHDNNIDDSIFPVNWTITADYNCHYQIGAAEVYKRSIGSHSLVDVNPRMTNPAGGDYSLNTGSPCIGKASDGTDIGLSGGLAGIFEKLTPGGKELPVAVSANPFRQSITLSLTGQEPYGISIYDVQGRLLRRLDNNDGRYTWDSRDGNNILMPSGMYWVAAKTAQGTVMTGILKAD